MSRNVITVSRLASGKNVIMPPRPRPAPSASASRSASRISAAAMASSRSEEHTSELQSRLHLVCRLLLEKKKTPYSFGLLYLPTSDASLAMITALPLGDPSFLHCVRYSPGSQLVFVLHPWCTRIPPLSL